MEESGMLDQKEYVFPTSSTSMYAATNYLMKAEAKTPPTMSTMLTPKNLIILNSCLTSLVLGTRYMDYTLGA
uniref:Uncharacterized protein n=1 Tax=Romanomermis culicivorax TaxID=13658 RepID=A0A915JPE6_ROMCU